MVIPISFFVFFPFHSMINNSVTDVGCLFSRNDNNLLLADEIVVYHECSL